jgi:hypothetical protein
MRWENAAATAKTKQKNVKSIKRQQKGRLCDY